MAKREYKTSTGRAIDFDTLSLKGEETIAVGNMGVNARGDKLGTGGEVVKSREEVMADYYRIHNGTIPEDKPDPDDDPSGPMDSPITADAVPTLEADNDPAIISSDELARALADAAPVVKEEPALKSVAAEKLAPIEQPTVKMPEEDNHSQEVKEEPAKVEADEPKGGLASAVAKVKTSKPVVKEKTAEQEEKAKGGVKRL
jgi:hypothetical protein